MATPSKTPLFSSLLPPQDPDGPLQEMTQLDMSIAVCQSSMRAATAALESHAKCSTMLSCWRALKKSEKELLEALTASNVDVTECGFHVLYELVCANLVAVRVQNVKLEVLTRLRGIASGDVSAEEAEVVAQLAENAIEIAKKIRERETKLLDHVLWLQQAVVLSARGEDDISLMESEEKQTKGTQWNGVFRTLFFLSGSENRVTTDKKDLSTSKDSNSSISVKDSKLKSEELSDLQLMYSSLNEAFSSADARQYFVAANEFLLVLKLYTEKCHTLDELLETAFLLHEKNLEETSVERQRKGEIVKRRKNSRTSWLTLVLSNIEKEILPEDSIHKPSYSMSLLFLILIWNISFCLWRNGSVREVYYLLNAVDVQRLQIFAELEEKEEEEKTKEEKEEEKEKEESKDISDKQKDMYEVPGHLTWQYVVEHCNQENSLSDSQEGKKSDGITETDSISRCEGMYTKHRKPKRIQELLYRITSLHDLSAIILYCKTKEDLLYILLTLNSALNWQRNRIQKDEKEEGKDKDNTISDKHIHMDASADILTVVLLVVEHFLSNKAVQLMEKSLLMSSSPPLTADVAVYQVCSELISFITYGKIKGLDDVDEELFPSLDDIRHEGGERIGDNNNNDKDEVLHYIWIVRQVIGMIQTFASGFRSSEMFQSSLSSMNKESEMEYSPPSIAGRVQNAVSRFLGGMGGSQSSFSTHSVRSKGLFSADDIEFHTNNHHKQQQQQKIISLLPLRCYMKKNSTEKGERGMLRFPSLHGEGLPLLLGEIIRDDCFYSVSEELALRLLVIACRYSDFQTLIPPNNMNEKNWGNCIDVNNENGNNNNNNNKPEDENDLLRFVIDKLNNAIGNLRSELDRRTEPSWLGTWHEQREFNATRKCTNSLCKLVQEGVYSTELVQSRLSTGQPNNQKTLENDEINNTVSLPYQKEDYPHDSLYNADESIPDITHEDGILHVSEGDLWEEVSAAYTPTVEFDYSAFTEGSAEALLAIRRLIEELTRKQTEEDGVGCGISVLPSAGRQLLHEELPAVWQFTPWRLVYSSRFHGSSYATLVSCSEREMYSKRRQTPMLLILELIRSAVPPSSTVEEKGEEREEKEKKEKDTLVIGACLSHPLHLGSHRFYGSGETFVFQLLLPPAGEKPQLRTFRSTGANQQFINCSVHTLAIGGGGGCSIFLNDSVTHGSTTACPTFSSPPLTQWGISASSTASWSSDAASMTGSDSTGTFEFEVKTAELLVIGEKREA